MSRYEKNKNMYEFYVGDRTTPYRFCVDTGLIYGIKGSALKNVPSELSSLVRHTWANYSNVLGLLRWYLCDGAKGYARLASAEAIKMLQLMDKLDAIQFPIINPWDFSEVSRNCQFLTDNFKALSAYTKEKGKGARITEFINTCHRELWFKTYNFQYNDHFTEEVAYTLYRYVAGGQYDTKECVSLYVYFLSRGLIDYEGETTGAIRKITCLLEMSEIAEMKIEKSDFFRQYINVRRTYLANKTAYDIKQFAYQQNQRSKALTYEDDNFVVIIPQTPAELVAEGKAQDNCVGGYADYVITGRCNVVFVRRKTDPNTAYITCEVRNGKINQYYTRFNRSVYADDAVAFQKAYAQHIMENW